MVVAERVSRTVNNLHRIVMRRLPTSALEDAYRDLQLGMTERSVCLGMGIQPDLFEGVLGLSLEEALWERGHGA